MAHHPMHFDVADLYRVVRPSSNEVPPFEAHTIAVKRLREVIAAAVQAPADKEAAEPSPS